MCRALSVVLTVLVGCCVQVSGCAPSARRLGLGCCGAVARLCGRALHAACQLVGSGEEGGHQVSGKAPLPRALRTLPSPVRWAAGVCLLLLLLLPLLCAAEPRPLPLPLSTDILSS